MYMTGPTVADSPNYAASPGMSSGVQFPSAFQTTINVQNALNSQAFLATTAVPNPSVSGQGETNDNEDSVDDPKLQEATKLIQYVLFIQIPIDGSLSFHLAIIWTIIREIMPTVYRSLCVRHLYRGPFN